MIISPPSLGPVGPAHRGWHRRPVRRLAAATAALASAGLKPRLARAERASAAAPPRGAEAPAAPASAGLPSLPASSLTMRWASLGPTPLARATIALSPRDTAAAQLGADRAPTGSPARRGRRRPGRWSAGGRPRARRPSRSRTGSSVLAHLKFGQQHDIAADRAQRVERPAAGQHLVADACTSITAWSAAVSASFPVRRAIMATRSRANHGRRCRVGRARLRERCRESATWSAWRLAGGHHGAKEANRCRRSRPATAPRFSTRTGARGRAADRLPSWLAAQRRRLGQPDAVLPRQGLSGHRP